MSPSVDLWQFALEVYGAPGVEEFCLHAQDELGVSPLLLLWAAWLEARGCAVADDDMARLQRYLEHRSHTQLLPLRSLRRGYRAKCSDAAEAELPEAVCADVRSHLLQAELAVEKHLLEWLATEAKSIEKESSGSVPPLDQLAVLFELGRHGEFQRGLARLRAAAPR